MPLYIIKPQNNVRLCEMICTVLHSVMIYQACGLDKKISNFCLTKVAYFLAGVEGFEPSKWRSQSPMPYHLATPQYYSVTTVTT